MNNTTYPRLPDNPLRMEEEVDHSFLIFMCIILFCFIVDISWRCKSCHQEFRKYKTPALKVKRKSVVNNLKSCTCTGDCNCSGLLKIGAV